MKTVVVDFSEIKAQKIWRLEAEFYNQKSLAGSNFVTGEDTIDFVQYGTSEELNECGQGFPILRLNEFEGLFIKTPEKYCERIDQETYKSLSLKKDDVLICRTNGNPKLVGKSALVPKDYDFAFASYLFRIRPKKDIINSASLTIYLNSRIGRSQIEKNLMVSNQANFSPAKFRDIQIPLLSGSIQKLIEKIVYYAYQKQESANLFYREAEQILLSELGLLNWKLKHCFSFIKNFSDTQSSKRIDAEYYQPRYEEIINKFQNNSQSDTLENITKLVGHPSNPPYASEDSKNKTFVITQKHLGNYCPSDNFWEDVDALYTTDDFIKKNKQYLLQKNDIILYSVGAYIGKANIYNSDIKATIGSFLTLIRPDQEKVNPYYLLVFINSEVGKQITRRCSRGMAQQYIYPFDIRKFVVPLISKTKQAEIEKKMLEALDTKALSKRLLDLGKRGVEMAIEKSEKEARGWIGAELKKHDVKLDQIQ
ncbi:MAG: restriction endonuclease subunit S [Bacteroidota bacterium]|nr:restriction endonuclease subunit S [Bacteroidota bacterium]